MRFLTTNVKTLAQFIMVNTLEDSVSGSVPDQSMCNLQEVNSTLNGVVNKDKNRNAK